MIKKKRIIQTFLAVIILAGMFMLSGKTAFAADIEDVDTKLRTDDLEKIEVTKLSEDDVMQLLYGKKGAKGGDYVRIPDPAAEELTPWEGGCSYAYSKLSDSQKILYKSVEQSLLSYLKAHYTENWRTGNSDYIATGAVDANLSANEIRAVFDAFYGDNVQYYFIMGGYSYLNGSRSYLFLSADAMYAEYSARQAADAAIAEVSGTWLSILSSIHDDYLKAIKVHDLIIERIDYAFEDEQCTQPHSAKWAHSIVGVFTAQGGVCEAYARCFSYTLNLAGVDNIYIVGDAGGAHAWNAVKLDGAYYLVDVTWDDRGGDDDTEGPLGYYEYFCMPVTYFGKSHRQTLLYELPSFSDSTDHVFYYYTESVMSGDYTDESMAAFVENAKSASYGNYIFFIFPNTDKLTQLCRTLGVSDGIRYSKSAYGFVYYYRYGVNDVPSSSIALPGTCAAIDVGGSVDIAATLSSGSNDRVKWTVSGNEGNIVKLTPSRTSVKIEGRKNGTVTLSAITLFSNLEATMQIKVGTGIADLYDFTVWSNGNKEHKVGTIVPTITVTGWKDAKGKEKKGKLVWLVMSEETVIDFDTQKHTVKTKSNGTKIAGVNAKGVLTAKGQPGVAHIYICDMGSCTSEHFKVEVRLAPTKLTMTTKANSFDKVDIAKKQMLDFGENVKLYITPFAKAGEVDETNTFSALVIKPEQESFIRYSQPERDENGGIYVIVTAQGYIKDKKKVATSKLVITNTESGKKTNITIASENSVNNITASAPQGAALAKKKDSVTLSLGIVAKDGTSSTTDKVKLFVAKTGATLDGTGKKVTVDKGATVKAVLSKDWTQVTLTAGKDCGETAVIYAAATDSFTKKVTLYKIAEVDAQGNVITSWSQSANAPESGEAESGVAEGDGAENGAAENDGAENGAAENPEAVESSEPAPDVELEQVGEAA